MQYLICYNFENKGQTGSGNITVSSELGFRNGDDFNKLVETIKNSTNILKFPIE